MSISLSIAKTINLKKMPYRLREIISFAQPSDPLRDEVLPTIDIAIPCHRKDVDNLHLVIQGARENVRNPIGQVILIAPKKLSIELEVRFPDCLILADESVLDAGIFKLVKRLVPEGRRGWVIQQLIKFQIAMSSNHAATLILDADTILLKPRVWLNGDHTQILCVAAEYHLPYKDHQRKMFGGQSSLLSFVTHHQLMKGDTVKEIFGCNGAGLVQWLQFADYTEESALSEYDTYGEWLVTHHPSKIRFAKWNNVSAKVNNRNTTYSEIRDRYSQFHSISNHSYLSQ
jgi:hypothetical protein